MSGDHFIKRTTFEDGYEVTSYYDKRSGLITETRKPSPGPFLDGFIALTGVDVDQLEPFVSDTDPAQTPNL